MCISANILFTVSKHVQFRVSRMSKMSVPLPDGSQTNVAMNKQLTRYPH